MTDHGNDAPPTSTHHHAREITDRLLNTVTRTARALGSWFACTAGHSPDELTNHERLVLEALWALYDADEKRGYSYFSARQVREHLRATRRHRLPLSARRALARLAELDYATELHMREGHDSPVTDQYVPLRKPGEHPPAICQASPFLMWLWQGRRTKNLTFEPYHRRAGIGNWYRIANPWEWAWLTSRPPLGADAHLTLEDPGWWEDPPPAAPGSTEQRP